MALVWRNAPCCERCWLRFHDMDGISAPWQLPPESRVRQECYSCGEVTVCGIQIRRQVEAGEAKEMGPDGAVLLPAVELEGPI